MWRKLDREGQGYITVDKFPDLVTFITIIHKVKQYQSKTKSKSVPQMDNQEIRSQVEHVSFWIAKRFIYNESSEFELRQDEVKNEFSTWCQQYVDMEGASATTT